MNLQNLIRFTLHLCFHTMKHFLLLLVFAASVAGAQSQSVFRAIIKDSSTNEPLQGVSVVLNNSGKGKITDKEGKILFANITSRLVSFTFSHTGYIPKSIQVNFPITDTSSFTEILLQPRDEEMEAVVVSSGRTNSRIEDLP